MSATLPATHLTFAKSESKAVGTSGRFMEMLRDNAPRISGGLKLPGDIAAGIIGGGLLIGYAIFAGVGRLALITWGTKANQKKRAEEQSEETGKPASIVQKILQPHKYPVESSAAMSVIGESFGVAYGIAQFAAGGTGFTPVIIGLIAVWSYAHMLLGKEKKDNKTALDTLAKDEPDKKQSLVFSQSSSKPVGWFGRLKETMKGNPVFTSSVVNSILSIGVIIGGIAEGLPAYAVAGVAGFVGSVVLALLVKKRDFNVEGALEDKQQSHVDRLANQRQNKGPDNDMAYFPA